MDFTLSEEQQLLQQTAREFARRQVQPRAAEIDEKHQFPADLVKAMAELGLMGVAVPESEGGAGMDVLSYVLAMEEVSAACASTGVIMSVQNSLVCDPIMRFGNAEQKKEFLVPLAQGKKLGCFALSEPDAGSDAAAQKTFAERDGDHYVINGVKNWITNGPEADLCVLLTMTQPQQRHRGITAFILPMDLPGVRRGAKENKLGITGSGTCQIFLENCRVPASLRLGDEGQGFKVAMSTLDGGRIGIAAQALGIARAALEAAITYGKDRKTFGKPVVEHQGIQFMLADMATQLDAARLLTWRAALLKSAGKPYGTASAMAKLMAAEVANHVAKDALQIHGGYGYVKEYPVERHFRDAKITEIYEGTSEIQRLVIARSLIKD
ncbi:MAG: acyl-CoA dehydrogenase [Deltaproteobacteria bacterium]|nr:acyl-CoA dehydrogenase [Deltaproteobacteria bacterium]